MATANLNKSFSEFKDKIDVFFKSTQKIFAEINAFMDKSERLLISQLEALKKLEETNEQLEDTVLDVILVMHQHDLIQSLSKEKLPRKKKNG